MPTDRIVPTMVPTIPMPAEAEWLTLSNELLAGLVHALNNRVTALSVCAELATLGDEQMLADGVLRAEVVRLQRVSALIGMLPSRGHVPEALELPAVLEDAMAIHAQHPRRGAVECTVVGLEAAQPVRAPRWALLRLLLCVVDAVKSAAQDAGRADVTLRLSSDERSVRVRGFAREGENAYATAMAARCGGTISRDGAELVLTLPALAQLRRLERVEPGGG